MQLLPKFQNMEPAGVADHPDVSGFRNIADMPGANIAWLEIGDLVRRGRIAQIDDPQPRPRQAVKPSPLSGSTR
jgi:hypothetical protein